MIKAMKCILICILGLTTSSTFTIFPSSKDVNVPQETIIPTNQIEPTLGSVSIYFPFSLYCSEVPESMGPQWRDLVTIGQTTVEELEELYGPSEIRIYGEDEILVIAGETWTIRFCANDNDVITALYVGSDIWYFEDYVAVLGVPDAVTFSDSVSRFMFWFEEGIAIHVYINTYAPEYYGSVNFMIYFPYQSSDGYEDRWPFNRTIPPNDIVVARDLSEEQNPFDFEAIVATITAQPSRTPTPTFIPRATTTESPSATPTP